MIRLLVRILVVVTTFACASAVVAQRNWWALPVEVSGLALNPGTVTYVLVERLNENAVRLGLSEARIQARVFTRLREAHIAATTNGGLGLPYIYVNVNALPTAASVTVEYNRPARIDVDGDWLPVTSIVWLNGRLLTFSSPTTSDGDRVMAAIDTLLDYFISDYVLANP